MTLTPAYGRDFKSKAAVLEAWLAGRDFIIADAFSGPGRYINAADAHRSGMREVTIRYSQLRKVCVLRWHQDTPAASGGTWK